MLEPSFGFSGWFWAVFLLIKTALVNFHHCRLVGGKGAALANSQFRHHFSIFLTGVTDAGSRLPACAFFGDKRKEEHQRNQSLDSEGGTWSQFLTILWSSCAGNPALRWPFVTPLWFHFEKENRVCAVWMFLETAWPSCAPSQACLLPDSALTFLASRHFKDCLHLMATAISSRFC